MFGVAAGHDHRGVGREPLGDADQAAGFAVGDVGDAAGVDQPGIGGGGAVDGDATCGLQLARGGLRFSLVQLAAERERGHERRALGIACHMVCQVAFHDVLPGGYHSHERAARAAPGLRRSGAMVEVGLAILFIAILLAADRRRYERFGERMREVVDWLDRPE